MNKNILMVECPFYWDTIEVYPVLKGDMETYETIFRNKDNTTDVTIRGDSLKDFTYALDRINISYGYDNDILWEVSKHCDKVHIGHACCNKCYFVTYEIVEFKDKRCQLVNGEGRCEMYDNLALAKQACAEYLNYNIKKERSKHE